jgi:hypothetical protein
MGPITYCFNSTSYLETWNALQTDSPTAYASTLQMPFLTIFSCMQPY